MSIFFSCHFLQLLYVSERNIVHYYNYVIAYIELPNSALLEGGCVVSQMSVMSAVSCCIQRELLSYISSAIQYLQCNITSGSFLR